jgi:hypothetical protein
MQVVNRRWLHPMVQSMLDDAVSRRFQLRTLKKEAEAWARELPDVAWKWGICIPWRGLDVQDGGHMPQSIIATDSPRQRKFRLAGHTDGYRVWVY